MRVDRRAHDRRTAAGALVVVVHVTAMVPIAVRVAAVVVSGVGSLGVGRWFLAVTVVTSVLISIEQRLLLLRSRLCDLTRRLGLRHRSRCGRLSLTSQHDGANGDSRVEKLRRQMPDAALNAHDPLLKFIGTSPAALRVELILWPIPTECSACSWDIA
jgi:hypothetical protein